MIIDNDLQGRYFDWLCGHILSGDNVPTDHSYKNLLKTLFETDFFYIIANDGNRADDGIELRYHFGQECGYSQRMIESYVDIDLCSVLEVLVSLAIHCSVLMDDPEKSNTPDKWFWIMIDNLGLFNMYDENYDITKVGRILDRFMNRTYEYNGEGGLFKFKNVSTDIRYVELWYQACWYLDEYDSR